MDHSSYAAPYDADRPKTEDGVGLPHPQPQAFYPDYSGYYIEQLADQNTHLQPPVSGSSAAPLPGEFSLTGSRKRSRDDMNDASLTTTPGAWPETPTSMDYSSHLAVPPAPVVKTEPPMDYIDLTGDESAISLSNYVDPFAQLEHAYQPGYLAPAAQAFNQEWMSSDELAQFLMTPLSTDVSLGAFPPLIDTPLPPVPTTAYTDPIVPRTQGLSLEEQLFGSDNEDDSTGDSVADPRAVQDLIENIRLNGDVKPEAREQTPKAMKSTLMEHQKIALTWLLNMERGKSKGGILADEMGLGKTVEALSLILANPSKKPACKTTLIVAPVALMRQWEKEIERHVLPEHRLSVYVYHGASKRADFDQLRTYDVVLTTYGTLAHELKLKETRMLWDAEDRDQQDRPSKRASTEKLSLLGHHSKWYRVVLDEAQCIKNRLTLTSKAANDLQAEHRLCMTGTPMMNSVDELFSLIRFLKIPPYNVWTKFSMEISKPLKNNRTDSQKRAMGRVQALLKSVMLRREKRTIVDGKEICQIPPKHVHEQHVEFSDEELSLYRAVETHSQVTLNRYLERGTVNNNYANVLVMLLRLRQLCCHPFLIKDLGVQVSTEGIDEGTLMDRAKQLDYDAVNRLTLTDNFECPICYETDPNPTIFIPCGHTTCGDCFQKLIDPSRAVREGHEHSAAKCPHCRDPLSSDRITDFEHFCKVHSPQRLKDMLQEKHLLKDGSWGTSSDSEHDANSNVDSDSDSDESDIDDKDETLGGFIVADDEEDDMDDDDEVSRGPSQDGTPSTGDERPRKDKARGKGKDKLKAKSKATVTLAQLKKDSLRNAAAKRKYLKRLRKQWKTSAKVERTLELLSEIRAADPTTKVLIFSQFTALLDLLEVPLSDRKMKYQRYDGSMRMNDRAEAVNQFMDTADENIMLVSLKAGNAGLNLSKASHVILLDPFWNPFVEEQAVDRAHRMPQKREVHVHRVLVPSTVEDRICALQEKKREIINKALDDKVGKSLSRLSVGELRYLFGMSSRA